MLHISKQQEVWRPVEVTSAQKWFLMVFIRTSWSLRRTEYLINAHFPAFSWLPAFDHDRPRWDGDEVQYSRGIWWPGVEVAKPPWRCPQRMVEKKVLELYWRWAHNSHLYWSPPQPSSALHQIPHALPTLQVARKGKARFSEHSKETEKRTSMTWIHCF